MRLLLFNKWILILFSAFLYSLAFIVSSLWWLVFMPFALLFYTMATHELSFKEGLLWGILFFGLQASGIFYSLFAIAQGAPSSFVVLAAVLLLLIFYGACYSGIWFWSTNIFIKRYDTFLFLQLLLWVVLSWLFTFVIDQIALWIFGSLEGYPLAHPLLPLALYPPFLKALPIIGKQILTSIFLFSTGLLGSIFLFKDTHKKLLIAVVALSPWLTSWSLHRTSYKSPEWLSKIAVLPESFYNPQHPELIIQEVKQKLKALIEKNPLVQLIVLPESALYLCDLSAYNELLKMWDHTHLSRAVHIITGALYRENNHCYNAVYWIFNGTVKKLFCKKHALLLTERLPQWAHNSSLKQLYYKDKPFITPSCNKREPFTITSTITLIPYICSEIFFKDWPDDTTQVPILSLCNDTWIAVPYIEHLMQLMHRFRALEWHRTILYVSYTNSYLYDAQGQMWHIKNTPADKAGV